MTDYSFMQLMDTEEHSLHELTVYNIGYEHTLPNKCLKSRIRPNYCIHFVFGGKGFFCDEPVEKGDCFMYCPNQKHDYYSDPNDPMRYGWIDFQGDYAENLLVKAGVKLENHVFKCDNIEVIEPYFQSFCAEKASRVLRSRYLTGCFHIMLSFIMQTNAAKARDADKKQLHIDAVIDYIEHSYSADLTAAKIAASVNLAPHYLSNIFKAELGITPMKYLMQVRMKRAAELLAIESLSIAEVARSVGYDDQLNFSNQFKRYSGLSPSAYRQQLLSKR